MSTAIKNIVLVHGAAHGAWCWELMPPLLSARGFTVAALDLPGLGDDRTPSAEVTYQSYVDRVVQFINAASTPVLLVGHSMGGASISSAAEAVPERVSGLVYVSAVVPENGMSSIASLPTNQSGAAHALRPGDFEGEFYFDPTQARELFYNRCTAAQAQAAIARLRPQNFRPMETPITLTPERWGAIPKTYVLCAQDNALSLDLQERLCNRLPGAAKHYLQADHSPFYSDPERLATILGTAAHGGQSE